MNGYDNLIRKENKYDILSVDLSKDRVGKCTTWKSLGFEVFEIINVICLALTVAYWIGRRMRGYQNERIKTEGRREKILNVKDQI